MFLNMFIIVHTFKIFMYSNLSVWAFMASVSHGMLTVFKFYWSFQQSPFTHETLTEVGLLPGKLAAFSMVDSFVSASSYVRWIHGHLALVPKLRRLTARNKVLWKNGHQGGALASHSWLWHLWKWAPSSGLNCKNYIQAVVLCDWQGSWGEAALPFGSREQTGGHARARECTPTSTCSLFSQNSWVWDVSIKQDCEQRRTYRVMMVLG